MVTMCSTENQAAVLGEEGVESRTNARGNKQSSRRARSDIAWAGESSAGDGFFNALPLRGIGDARQ